MARDVIDAVLGPAARRRARATRPSGGWSARPTPTRWTGSRPSSSTIPAVARRRTGGRGTARRPPRDGGAGRRRARRGARPAPAARPGPPVPRGRGRVGGPPRAGAVARRRPGAPDPARPRSCPTAARRSRRASRRSWPRELGWGDGAPGARGRDVPRNGAREYSVAAAGDGAGAAAPIARRRRRPSTDRAIAGRHRPVTIGAHPRADATLGDLQRTFFDGLYTCRIPVAIGSAVVAVVVLVVAWRRGWFAAARRHPAGRASCSRSSWPSACRSAGTSPRRSASGPSLVEPGPIRPSPAVAPVADRRRPSRQPVERPARVGVPPAAPRLRRPVADAVRRATRSPRGSFHGTDDFHFGAGRRRSSRPRRARYHLRLEDFSVRNGPDLYVYLSPDADDYADGALELGKLKATDGAFGYDLPAGTDPADFASAIIWCKQFTTCSRSRRSTPPDARRTAESQGYGKRTNERVPSRCKCHGSVRGQNVARRNSDSSHG